jgi:thiol-disulfide isomerase/thioredoxin
MRRVIIVGLALLAAGPLSASDDSDRSHPPPGTASPAQQLTALKGALEKEQERLGEAMRQAKTGAESKQLLGRANDLLTLYARRALALARKYPTDPAAVDALLWVVTTRPTEGMTREGQEALDLLARDHLQDPRLIEVCQALTDTDHRSVEHFFRTLLARSPRREVRARACLSLALCLRDRRQRQQEEQRAAAADESAREALTYFERAAGEYGDVKFEGRPLREAVTGDVFELRHLTVGNVAPEVQGQDSSGRPLKLTDHRGRVVVLVFWAGWCEECIALLPQERALVERMRGKPFILLGVDSDGNRDQLQTLEREKHIPWRSWFDGRAGAVGRKWNIRYLPTIYVLDARGVIRYRDVRGKALDAAVDALVRETQSANKP